MASSLIEKYSLTPVTPDFDDIYEQIQGILTSQAETPTSGAWTEALEVATGSFILRVMASVTADNAFALERTLHEVYLDTARRPSSIYRAARSEGVHILRKTPASVLVQLTRTIDVNTTTVTIPEYTAFQVGGSYFFNRNKIVFAMGVNTVQATLHNGLLVNQDFTSTGEAWQTYVIGQKDFSVSDADLFAIVGSSNDIWNKTTKGLWEYSGDDKIFYENTTPNGQVEIKFGNNIHGAIPPANERIRFRYVAVTDNDASLQASIPIASPVLTQGYPDIVGATLSIPSGHIDERDPEFYRIMAPSMNDADPILSTRDNYRAVAVQYPGVLDAVFRGQAEINPSDLRWMNGVSACLLTATPWGDSDFNQFVNYMHNNGNSTLHLYREDPIESFVDLELTIYVVNRAELNTVKNQAESILKSIFAKQLGSLGKKYAITDLGFTLKDKITDPYGNLVTYVDFHKPTVNISNPRNQYSSIRNLKIDVKYDTSDRFRVVRGVSVPLVLGGE